jgi:hypothetical protein
VLAGGIAQAKKRYRELKSRYGPRYTYAMVSVAFFTLFLPIPGISLVSIALVIVAAELHRAYSGRGRFTEAIVTLFKRVVGTYPKELVMSMKCDIFLKWSATPAQLRAVGDAFWLWCNRAEGNTGIYKRLDNQALADLIAGRFPTSLQAPWPIERRGVRVRVWDEAAHDPHATLDSLRRTIPSEGIEDLVVDDVSWDRVAQENPTCAKV